MKKIMDISMPLIKGYPHHANLLGIIGNNSYELPAMYNYYVPIVFNIVEKRLDFSIGYDIVPFLSDFPMLISNKVSRTMVKKKWNNFHEFIISSIDDDGYVYCLVDTFFIKAYKGKYQKEHYTHDMMIYGYDTEKEIVYIADCFVNGVYEFQTATFEEINKSFEERIENDWIKGVWIFRQEEIPYRGIGYDTNKIRNDIDEYIRGEMTESINIYEKYQRNAKIVNNDMEVSCGINVYEKIIQYMIEMVKQKKEVDVRINYMLYEHKNFLCVLCNELYAIGQFENSFGAYGEILKNKTRLSILNNLILKYNITKDERNIFNVIEKLMDVRENERKMMRALGMSIHDFGAREDYRKNKKILCTDIKIDYRGEWDYVSRGIYDVAIAKNEWSCCKLIFFGNEITVIVEECNISKEKVCIDCKNNVNSDIIREDGIVMLHCSGLTEGYHIISINDRNIRLIGFDVKTENKIESENFAELVGIDEHTKGNWIGKYGKEGYMIVGLPHKLPDYMTTSSIQIYNSVYIIMKRIECDDRCPLLPNDFGKRIQAIKVSHNEIVIDIIITGNYFRMISFYLVDFEQFGRSVEIKIIDADTEEVLLVNVVKKYGQGVFTTYNIKGHIKVRLINISNPDVVLSGIFID